MVSDCSFDTPAVDSGWQRSESVPVYEVIAGAAAGDAPAEHISHPPAADNPVPMKALAGGGRAGTAGRSSYILARRFRK